MHLPLRYQSLYGRDLVYDRPQSETIGFIWVIEEPEENHSRLNKSISMGIFSFSVISLLRQICDRFCSNTRVAHSLHGCSIDALEHIYWINWPIKIGTIVIRSPIIIGQQCVTSSHTSHHHCLQVSPIKVSGQKGTLNCVCQLLKIIHLFTLVTTGQMDWANISVEI